MNIRLAPGTIVPLRHPLGEAWAPARSLEFVLVLVQPDPPFDAAYPEVRVAPISRAVEMRSDLDVLCFADESGLGVDFLVEVWNQRAMLLDELDTTHCARVSDAVLKVVYAVHEDMLGRPTRDEIPAERVGAPIETETDPRIQYQTTRAEIAEALSRGADRLIAPRRRAERTVSVDAVYEVIAGLALHAGEALTQTLSRWPWPWEAPAQHHIPAVASHEAVRDALEIVYYARMARYFAVAEPRSAYTVDDVEEYLAEPVDRPAASAQTYSTAILECA